MNTTGDDLPWPGGYERRGPSSPLRVLIGLDDLEGSAHLLAYAKVLDKAGNAIARVLHVVEHVTAMAGPVIETPEEALALVDEAVFSLRMAGVGASGTVRHGRVNRIATVLLDEAASWQADAIVLSGCRTRAGEQFPAEGCASRF